MYQRQYLAMESALEELLPQCKFNKPTGGFYVWLELPEGMHSKELLPKALEAGVAFVPGTGFFATGEGGNYMRLSFCYPSEEEIREGIRRLASVINS
jgi:DNA-binding transcriptional MocR family regulator